jgi:hypothetical protein
MTSQTSEGICKKPLELIILFSIRATVKPPGPGFVNNGTGLQPTRATPGFGHALVQNTPHIHLKRHQSCAFDFRRQTGYNPQNSAAERHRGRRLKISYLHWEARPCRLILEGHAYPPYQRPYHDKLFFMMGLDYLSLEGRLTSLFLCVFA